MSEIRDNRGVIERVQDKGLAQFSAKSDNIVNTIMQGSTEDAVKTKELAMRDTNISDQDKQEISNMFNQRIRMEQAMRNGGQINRPQLSRPLF